MQAVVPSCRTEPIIVVARQRPLDMRVRVQQIDGNAAASCRQKIVLAEEIMLSPWLTKVFEVIRN